MAQAINEIALADAILIHDKAANESALEGIVSHYQKRNNIETSYGAWCQLAEEFKDLSNPRLPRLDIDYAAWRYSQTFLSPEIDWAEYEREAIEKAVARVEAGERDCVIRVEGRQVIILLDHDGEDGADFWSVYVEQRTPHGVEKLIHARTAEKEFSGEFDVRVVLAQMISEVMAG